MSIRTRYSANVPLPPYPCLENGNASYPKGEYDPVISGDGENFPVIVNHHLKHAQFIESAIADGKAKYACVVSVPNTGYRETHTSSEPKHSVDCEKGLLGELPWFQPMIVTTREFGHDFTEKDGVLKQYCRRLTIPEGARLARGEYQRPSESPLSLLSVRQNDKIAKGSFEVKPPNPDDGFRFTVEAPEAMYKLLRSRNDFNQHQFHSIVTHIIHACFDMLKSEYRDKPMTPTLLSLEGWMESKGAGSWRDDDFSPLKAATKVYPHNPVLEAGKE